MACASEQAMLQAVFNFLAGTPSGATLPSAAHGAQQCNQMKAARLWPCSDLSKMCHSEIVVPRAESLTLSGTGSHSVVQSKEQPAAAQHKCCTNKLPQHGYLDHDPPHCRGFFCAAGPSARQVNQPEMPTAALKTSHSGEEAPVNHAWQPNGFSAQDAHRETGLKVPQASPLPFPQWCGHHSVNDSNLEVQPLNMASRVSDHHSCHIFELSGASTLCANRYISSDERDQEEDDTASGPGQASAQPTFRTAVLTDSLRVQARQQCGSPDWEGEMQRRCACRKASTQCLGTRGSETVKGLRDADRQEWHAGVVAQGFPPPRSMAAMLRPSESYIHAHFALRRRSALTCGGSSRADGVASPPVQVGDGSTGNLSCSARQRRIFKHVEASLRPPPVSRVLVPESKREVSATKAQEPASDLQKSSRKLVPFTICEEQWDISPHVWRPHFVEQFFGLYCRVLMHPTIQVFLLPGVGCA
jgi:hypothetical protein